MFSSIVLDVAHDNINFSTTSDAPPSYMTTTQPSDVGPPTYVTTPTITTARLQHEKKEAEKAQQTAYSSKQDVMNGTNAEAHQHGHHQHKHTSNGRRVGRFRRWGRGSRSRSSSSSTDSSSSSDSAESSDDDSSEDNEKQARLSGETPQQQPKRHAACDSSEQRPQHASWAADTKQQRKHAHGNKVEYVCEKMQRKMEKKVRKLQKKCSGVLRRTCVDFYGARTGEMAKR